MSLAETMVTLGRSADCTVPMRDRFLSRHHAEIVPDAGQWYVRDCGSVNGTMLNGGRVSGRLLLQGGDRIALGDSEVLFHDGESPSTATSQLVAIDSDSQ